MTKREKIKQSLLARVPKGTINQFLSSDKTPISVLLLSCVVGILAGLVGTLFEIGVHFVTETRTDWLKDEIGSVLPLWLLAFVISAFLAFIGYFLVHKFAPKLPAQVFQKLKGRWTICALFVGGVCSR